VREGLRSKILSPFSLERKREAISPAKTSDLSI
jgi:hypothetical protein